MMKLKSPLKKHPASLFTLISCGALMLIISPFGGLAVSQPGSENNKSNLNSPPETVQQVPDRSRPSKKYIGEHIKLPTNPIVFTDVKVKGRSVQTNQHFDESGDWLNGLLMRVKNNSGKRILYFSFFLMFPETKENRDRPVIGYPFQFGTQPPLPTSPVTGDTFDPDEEMEFTISGEIYEALTIAISKKKPLNSINIVILRTVRVIFDDNTGWDQGMVIRRDPNNPQRWVDVN